MRRTIALSCNLELFFPIAGSDVTPRDLSPEITLDTGTQCATLRLLATTDVHMNILGHDYVSDQPSSNPGLVGLATLIEQAREEARQRGISCLLFDNGDLLQGNAMGDYLATRPVTDQHPVIAALELMRYDAVGIGNHDLDHGLPYLEAVAQKLTMPMISTNLSLAAPTYLRRSTLLDTEVAVAGTRKNETLRIGVLSALPAQTAVWNHHVLEDVATVETPSECVSAAVKQLRVEGADIVILLAHMGIDEVSRHREIRDNALSLAQIPGIDAIIAGHTHRRFPGSDHKNSLGVDSVSGMLAQRPAVMPGHSGSDLAVLDLTLRRTEGLPWHVSKHLSQLRANSVNHAPHEKLRSACEDMHKTTRRRLSHPVGVSKQRMHNFFSLAAPTRTCALLASAKARAAREALVGLPEAKLPLLVTAAAHTAGGRGGPDHYLDIPSETLLRRHIAGMCPYANTIWVLHVTSETLRLWLEHAAEVYLQLHPDRPNQLLLDSDIPPFNFDTIYGITYQIDPSQPIGTRIKALLYDGIPLSNGQEFLLATNQFRAAGGGGFQSIHATRLVLKTNIRTDDALRRLLATSAEPIWEDHIPWSFACPKPVRAILETSPRALDHLDEIAHLRPQPLGIDTSGFAQIKLSL